LYLKDLPPATGFLHFAQLARWWHSAASPQTDGDGRRFVQQDKLLRPGLGERRAALQMAFSPAHQGGSGLRTDRRRFNGPTTPGSTMDVVFAGATHADGT
jgi:hypothetical protein